MSVSDLGTKSRLFLMIFSENAKDVVLGGLTFCAGGAR